MRKIMLVVDEYTELVTLENLLRRLGFDVLSLGKEVLVADALLRFVPDIVIMTVKGKSVDGARLAAKLKKLSPPPKVVFLYAPLSDSDDLTPEVRGFADAFLMLPSQPTSTIKAVADLAGLDAQILLDKYGKIASTKNPEMPEAEIIRGTRDTESNVIKVKSLAKPSVGADKMPVDPWPNDHEEFDPVTTAGQAATLRSARSDRYEQFLQQHQEPVDQTLSREAMVEAAEILKAESEEDGAWVQKVEREKREFVKALFAEETKIKPEE